MARDWIDMLTDLARSQDRAVPEDPRFDALVEGALTDEELAQLEQEASHSPASLAALAACSPLDADVKDRMFKRAQVDLSSPPTGEFDPLHVPDELESAPPSPRKSPVRAQVLIPLLLGGFLLSAGAGTYLAWPSQPVLAPCDVAVQGGTAGQLLITLRAREAGGQPSDTRVYLNEGSSTEPLRASALHPLAARVVAAGDTTTIEVSRGSLGGGRAMHELVVVAVARGKVPQSDAELEAVLQQGSRSVRVYRQPVRISGR